MHRHGQSHVDDSESLQADVMRFMAIIAFCLIAILALVKHAEPVETTNNLESPAPEPEVPHRETPTQEAPRIEAQRLALVEPEPVVLEPEPTPLELPPEPVTTPEAVAEPEPTPPAAVAQPVSTPPPMEPESPAEPEEEGLILRFASDGDFLRLIARGDIQVYAFQQSDVLTLSESYRFLDTQSPGQVYELLPPSIPALIVDALKQARNDIDGYRWGIALPGHISNQIERHLNQVSGGQLVIDRYGDVHHVAAS